MSEPGNPRPWWLALLCILTILPAFGAPWLSAAVARGGADGARTLAALYPFATVAYGILAWLTYPRRGLLCAILCCMAWLTTAAIYSLALLT